MLVSLDLGSKDVGLVVLADALPLRVIVSKKLDVDRANLDPTAGQIIGTIDLAARMAREKERPPPRVVIEWGRFFVGVRDTPAKTAAAASSMGENRDPMICLRDRVEQHCARIGIAVLRIPVQTWRSRIGCQGKGDEAVTAALVLHGPTSALESEHERDAAGAALGVLLGEQRGAAPKSAIKRIRCTPRTLARRAHDAQLDALLEAQQSALATASPLPIPARVKGEHARGRQR